MPVLASMGDLLPVVGYLYFTQGSVFCQWSLYLDSRKILCYTVAANLASFAAGLWLAVLIPGIF